MLAGLTMRMPSHGVSEKYQRLLVFCGSVAFQLGFDGWRELAVMSFSLCFQCPPLVTCW